MSVIVSAGAGRVVTLSDLQGDAIHDSGFAATSGGVAVQVLSVTIAAGKKRRVTRCLLSCSIAGKMEVKLNGTVIGVARTAPGDLNAEFNWTPTLPITAGDIIAVWFTARAFSPAADVEGFLMSAQTDI